MNKLAAMSLLTAGVLSLAPSPAIAGSKEKALIGGLIGGLIIGHAITESHRSACPPEPDTVVVYDSREDNCGGCWRETRVQVWVPGYWVTHRNHGHRVRYYVSGRHEWRTNRVWVADAHGDRHGRRDHRYAYNR